MQQQAAPAQALPAGGAVGLYEEDDELMEAVVADIDRRQAARRVSRQANQMRVAATARARITLEGNLPAVTDTGAVGCAFKTVSTTSRQRGLEDVRPSRWRKCARRVFGSR